MKLPALLLAAITTAVVVASCTKSVDTTPSANPGSVDTANNSGENHPNYCPACGMG